ncbi:MAG: hypothetical protein P4M02_10820, partial [Clostridia bacterium]|nr:hypothetical protein [Clostridia bacterium]
MKKQLNRILAVLCCFTLLFTACLPAATALAVTVKPTVSLRVEGALGNDFSQQDVSFTPGNSVYDILKSALDGAKITNTYSFSSGMGYYIDQIGSDA